MEMLVIGIATAFNFMILKWKFEHERYADLALDVATLVALSFLFGGTLGGMTIAMIPSACVSLFLLVSPPKFTQFQ